MINFSQSHFEIHGCVLDVMDCKPEDLEKDQKPWRSVAIGCGRQVFKISAGERDWHAYRVGDIACLVGEPAADDKGNIKIKRVRSLKVRQNDGNYAEVLTDDPAAVVSPASVAAARAAADPASYNIFAKNKAAKVAG